MMVTMKRYAAVLLMAALVCVSNAGAEELEVVDRIVAVVNDEIITYSVVSEAFAPYEKKLRKTPIHWTRRSRCVSKSGAT